MDEYINEFNELVESIPLEEMSPMDQLAMVGAWMELIQKVKPIYEKYALKGNIKKTFLMRIKEEGE